MGRAFQAFVSNTSIIARSKAIMDEVTHKHYIATAQGHHTIVQYCWTEQLNYHSSCTQQLYSYSTEKSFSACNIVAQLAARLYIHTMIYLPNTVINASSLTLIAAFICGSATQFTTVLLLSAEPTIVRVLLIWVGPRMVSKEVIPRLSKYSEFSSLYIVPLMRQNAAVALA